MVEQKSRLQEIGDLMETLVEDRTIPRNIRKTVADGKEKIFAEKGDPSVAISSTIYMLEEASNDVNIPSHARTRVWELISELERAKEELIAHA